MSDIETPIWHGLLTDEVLKRLGSSRAGLISAEAEQRLVHEGRNEIARRKPISPLRLLIKQFASFFVLVLVFAAALAFAVSFLPGESGRRLTAFFILGIIALSVVLSFFEEYRAQKELDALDKLLIFKTEVIRDGVTREIDAAEVVPGDILVLRHGQKVPADARVVDGYTLRTDESALTGESVGVDKSPQVVAPDTPLAERTSMVYGTTWIIHGTGLGVAVRTGMKPEVGRIAAALEEMTERPTPFQTEVQKMSRQMTLIVGVLAVIVALILLLMLQEPLVDVALNTLSLAVATIPESLPIVLTFALALGAHQMAARHAVVRRLSIVESLGSVDTICTDKTGTLTQNSMTVQYLFSDGRLFNIPPTGMTNNSLVELLRAGVLCSEASLENGRLKHLVGDPVEAALLRAAIEAGVEPDRERADYPKSDEIPFSSERKMMTTVHKHNGNLIAYSKGAPEAILGRCSFYWQHNEIGVLDETQRRMIQGTIEQLERDGMYVIALARRSACPPVGTDQLEQQMVFLGAQALIDPPRSETHDAIAKALVAGIRVVMITGDNALTARAIARQLGIGERAAEATELEALSREAMRARVREIDIVARATPQIKQRVLQALQEAGHFVAMTGDGVNDATALKQSDVGVAMGLRGTDIAKESAAMVLLDDNFSTIIAAIEEGRRIFDNIRKFTNYLLSTSLGEVLVVLTLSAAGYFPLSAKMLLWVNVVTDLIPASALAADPAVPQVMKRRPRHHDEPILNQAIYATIVGSIFRTLIAYTLLFWIGLRLGGVIYARTMLFTSIVLHAFSRVLVVRQIDALSIWSNRALLWSYVAAVFLQLLALYTPLRDVFGVVALDWRAWAVMLPVVVGSSLAGVFMTRWILGLVPVWESSLVKDSGPSRE
jgi:Ca2+-transporting ATPase